MSVTTKTWFYPDVTFLPLSLAKLRFLVLVRTNDALWIAIKIIRPDEFPSDGVAAPGFVLRKKSSNKLHNILPILYQIRTIF